MVELRNLQGKKTTTEQPHFLVGKELLNALDYCKGSMENNFVSKLEHL